MAYWVVKGEAPRSRRSGQATPSSASANRRPRWYKGLQAAMVRREVQVQDDAKTKSFPGKHSHSDAQTTSFHEKADQTLVKKSASAKLCGASLVSQSSCSEQGNHKDEQTKLSNEVELCQDTEGRVATEPDAMKVAACPSGHILQSFTTGLPAICGVCGAEFAVGSMMWGCRECDFDTCVNCYGVASDTDACKSRTERHATVNPHDGTSTASTDTPRGDNDVTWTQVDGVWWPQEATWSWNWREVQKSRDDELQADETLMGPDGELYEVFYPAEISLPQFSPVQPSQAWDVDSSLHGQMVLDTSSNSAKQQTSAEIGIGTILAYMRGVAVARYPAKARLFETVQTATTIALGDHFQRFALVGSTAVRIDTPDSDLDAVAFTRTSVSISGEEHPAPPAVQILQQVAKTLRACDPSLRLQLVDCTRVPVLTVYTGDGELSLDLTVDQALSEYHVLWLQSQRIGSFSDAPFVQEVPVPTLDGWEQGLEAATLRCVKWWLRRRHIPVSKEGGYPTVVWTLMVMHVLRCSVFYNEADGSRGKPIADERSLLGAIATFFDRFTEGALLFAEGKNAEFWPQLLNTDSINTDSVKSLPVLSGECFSVLDPTTTKDSAAFGTVPVELAPRISSATQLLHAYELSRGQHLSQIALTSGEDSLSSDNGGVALSALFAESNEQYLLPAFVPPEPVGVMFLRDGSLVFGILQRINLKHGWGATFLNRRDAQTKIAVTICDVDADTHTVTPGFGFMSQQWLQPCDVVCMASVIDAGCRWDYQESPIYNMDDESLDRWCKMQALLHVESSSTCSNVAPRKASHKNKKYDRKNKGKAGRI